MPIHVGDTGIRLRATIKENGSTLDISAATALEMRLRGPDGAIETLTASFVTDGTNGQVEAQTGSGDLYMDGEWEARPHFSLDGWSGHTGALRFRVVRV